MFTSFDKLLQPHYRNPQGLLGRLALGLMARRNRTLNRLALQLAAARGGEHILEIGFGRADTLGALLESDALLMASAVDWSPLAVQLARKRYAEDVRVGRLTLHRAEAHQLPFDATSFDRVICIDCLRFVDAPTVALREWRRVMRPGGLLVLAFQHDETKRDAPREHAAELEELAQMLVDAGFFQVAVSRLEQSVQHEGPVVMTAVRRDG